jgi:hypothetical protein
MRRQLERNKQTSRKHQVVSLQAQQRGAVDIQQHEAKRRLENELFMLREELEEEGVLTEQEIEERIQQERSRRSAPAAQPQGVRDTKQTAHHKAVKQNQEQRLGMALGISSEAHIPGAAFDQELQKEKREQLNRLREQEKQQQALEELKEKSEGKKAKESDEDNKKPKHERRKKSQEDDEHSSDSDDSDSDRSSSSSSSSSAPRRKKRRRR